MIASLKNPLRTALLALAVVSPCLAQLETKALGGVAAAAVKTQGRVQIPADAMKILPPNVVAYVQGTSIKEIEDAAKAVVSAIDPRMARNVSLNPMIGPMASLGLVIDNTKSIGFAVGLPESPENEPVMCFLLPLSDVEKSRAALQEKDALGAACFSGSYCGMSSGGPYQPVAEPPAFLKNGVPEGQVGAVADAEQAIAFYRPMIDAGLEEVAGLREMIASDGGPQSAAAVEMFDGAMSAVRSLLDEVGIIETSARANGASVDWRAAMMPRAGKTMSIMKSLPGTDGNRLASIIGDGYPMTFLSGIDMKSFMTAYFKLTESVIAGSGDPALSEMFTKLMKSMQSLMGKMGPGLGMGMTMSGGMNGVAVYESSDGEGLISEMMKLCSDPEFAKMGVTAKTTSSMEVAGAKATRIEIAIDMQKMMALSGQELPEEAVAATQGMMKQMFGGETFVMTMAPVGKYVVGVMGRNDAELARAIAAAKGQATPTGAGLQNCLAACGGRPALLVHLELRALMASVLGMMAEFMPGEPPKLDPKGPPAPASLYIAPANGGLVMGIGADVGGIGKMVKELDK